MCESALTIKEMHAANYARQLDLDPNCDPTDGSLWTDLAYRASDGTKTDKDIAVQAQARKKEYLEGRSVCDRYTLTYGNHTTNHPTLKDNQILVTAGFTAAKPVYRVVTFNPR